jgi:hypothetical protein
MARNALLGMAQMPTLQYRPETQVESLGKATQAVGGLQGIQMRQMEMEKAKQDSAMLQQFRQTMMQAGKNPDPSVYGQALIQTGRPDLVTKGSEIMRAVQSEAALKQELGGYRLAQGDARGVAQSMAVSPTPGMAQRAQALTRTLPPEARPEKPESPYINVGGALYERATGRWLQPPSVRGEPTPRAPALTEVQDPTNPDRILRVDANVYQSGGPNSPGVIGVSGKSAAAAAKVKKVEEGQAQAQDIIDTLRGAYARLNDLNAVPSTQRGVLSNAFAYIAGTAPGQIAGRMAGTEEQVERDVIGSARNQVLNAVKNATGMSAQQLNSNVEFMSWLKSLTDPTVAYEANQRILDNLEKFIASGGKYSERKASGSVTPAAPAQRGAVGGEPPAGNGALTPAEQAELEQLRQRLGRQPQGGQ